MLPNQRSISLSKKFTAAIITLSQMHTIICVRFLKLARIVGHLSCPFAFFLLNHSLFRPISCADVFKPVIVDQLLTTSCLEFPFHSSFAVFVILCLLHY